MSALWAGVGGEKAMVQAKQIESLLAWMTHVSTGFSSQKMTVIPVKTVPWLVRGRELGLGALGQEDWGMGARAGGTGSSTDWGDGTTGVLDGLQLEERQRLCTVYLKPPTIQPHCLGKEHNNQSSF